MFILCYLRALESSRSIQVLAGAAYIANQRGLAVLGSRPYEVSVKDKDVRTAGVLCLLPLSEVSIPPALRFSCPSPLSLCSLSVPLQSPRSWWMFSPG